MDKYQKEKEFHDKEFSDSSRIEISKFYSIAQLSNNFYIGYLRSISKDKELLELGCGPGNRSFQLAGFGAHVTGIDISEVAITKAKERAKEEKKDAHFKVMNAEELRFDSESFDVICGISILHHLELENIYSGIAKILKIGGKAVFIEPLGHNPFINLFRKLTPSLRTEDEHPLLIKDIKTAKKYFKQIEWHHFHLFTLFAVPFRKFSWFQGLLKMLAGFDRLLFKFIPFLRRYSWIVVVVFKKVNSAPSL